MTYMYPGTTTSTGGTSNTEAATRRWWGVCFSVTAVSSADTNKLNEGCLCDWLQTGSCGGEQGPEQTGIHHRWSAPTSEQAVQQRDSQEIIQIHSTCVRQSCNDNNLLDLVFLELQSYFESSVVWLMLGANTHSPNWLLPFFQTNTSIQGRSPVAYRSQKGSIHFVGFLQI